MKQVDILLMARWVLPIAPQNIVLEDHAVAILDGRIIDVLPQSKATAQYEAAKLVELKEHVVMPGLINAHAHTPMNLFRGLADDLELMDWLNNHIWPAEKALINEKSVEVGSRLAIAEMLRGGVTCFNDNYFFPDVTARVAIEEGIRASLGCVVMSVPTEWASDEAGYFAKARQTLENQSGNPLINWTVCPHAPYTVSDDSLKKVKALSDEFNIPIHMHMHETQFEIDSGIEQYGKRPFQRVYDLGLYSPRFMHVHVTQLTDQEIQIIADTGSHVVHCPESNLKLASGFAPIAKIVDKGINVAIGTDGAASNNDLDMFGELRLASLLAKAVSGNPTTLSATKVLEMATINGAKALGIDHEVGSLEKGKAADIIAIDLSSYLTQPVYNPISHLAYCVNRLQVSDVWIAGKHLLVQGRFAHLDTQRLREQAHYWAEKAQPFSSSASKMKSNEETSMAQTN